MKTFDYITAEYWDDFLALMHEFLPDSDDELAAQKYTEFPKAYVGYYDNDKLLGIAYGWYFEQHKIFGLDGITVAWELHAKGIGSLLLKFFEDNVKAMGYDITSVGSAGGYVEHFYIKNGYIPTAYKAFDNNGKLHMQKLNVIDDYNTFDREKIIAEADGNEGFLVLEHKLN